MIEMALKFLCEGVSPWKSPTSTVSSSSTPRNKKEKKQLHCHWSLSSITLRQNEGPEVHHAQLLLCQRFWRLPSIGVGMGCEPSAPAANLALAAREKKWVKLPDPLITTRPWISFHTHSTAHPSHQSQRQTKHLPHSANPLPFRRKYVERRMQDRVRGGRPRDYLKSHRHTL